jgi:ABC-type glutathione transport system ATPase component
MSDAVIHALAALVGGSDLRRRYKRPGVTIRISNEMQQIVRERGLTCVLITHDTAQAARLAKRALLLEAGRIVRDGPLQEVPGA